MSARIAAGTHAGSSALRSESRPGNPDNAARAASPLEAGGRANVADAEGASAQDNADGSGGSGGSRHFATALADAGAAPSRANDRGATAGAPAGQGRSSAAASTSRAATASASGPAQTQTPLQTQPLADAQSEAVVASAPGAAAITAADEKDSSESSGAPATGSSVDSSSDGPTHGAAHRGHSSAGLVANATDLLSSLALLQASVAAMTLAPTQVQVDASPGGMDEGAQNADDLDTLQSIGDASTAYGSDAVDSSAGAASGVTAQVTDTLSNFTSWLTTTAAPAGTQVIPGTGTGSGAGAGGTADAKTEDSIANVAARAASLLPQLLATIPTGADSSAVSPSINVPVSDPSWPQALAAQVQWMLGSQLQSATLRLSPAHLGPIQIRIDLQQSQINVSFSAAHTDTRSALTEAIPRLREMLASGGLTLGQANVQQEAPGGGHAQSQRSSAGGSDALATETAEPVALAQTWALGLVDEYA